MEARCATGARVEEAGRGVGGRISDARRRIDLEEGNRAALQSTDNADGDGHRRSADGEGDRRNGQRGCAEIDRAEEEQTAQIEGLGENGRGLGDRDHVAAEGHYVCVRQ